MDSTDLRLVAADDVAPADLHAAFTHAFSDYLIGPFLLSPDQWPGFLARQAVDLSLSRVAMDGDRPVAFAFVAPRDATRWRLGTMGAVPAARGRGAAPRLLEDFLARAGQAGVDTVELEVFAQNERALALYRKHGFRAVHELHGWTRVAPAASDVEDPDVAEVALEDAFAWLAGTSPRLVGDLPLQAMPRVLRVHGPALRAWRHGGAQLVFAPGTDPALPVMVHGLVDRQPAQHDADVLVAALLARHPGRTIRVPALQRRDVGGDAFDRAGFVHEPLHQLLMRRPVASA